MNTDIKAPIVTVFYEGMFNSPVQAAKLVGAAGFEYPYTNEKIQASKAIECIVNLHVSPVTEEVELLNVTHSAL